VAAEASPCNLHREEMVRQVVSEATGDDVSVAPAVVDWVEWFGRWAPRIRRTEAEVEDCQTTSTVAADDVGLTSTVEAGAGVGSHIPLAVAQRTLEAEPLDDQAGGMAEVGDMSAEEQDRPSHASTMVGVRSGG